MIVEMKIVDWNIPMGAYAPETKRGVINTDDVSSAMPVRVQRLAFEQCMKVRMKNGDVLTVIGVPSDLIGGK
jgi:hypothetical protein